MYEFFEDLLKLINNEVYEPIRDALTNSDWFNEFVNFINNLLIALFGNTSQITTNQVASIICITFLIMRSINPTKAAAVATNKNGT